MKTFNYEHQEVTLQRVASKKWIFDGNEPKRVELAVLDYYRSLGYRGYFTEHFDFDNTLLCMMCWCNNEKYLNKVSSRLQIGNVGTAFACARDGIYPTYKFSTEYLLDNASCFNEESISRILNAWRDNSLKGFVVGRAYLKGRNSSELIVDDLISFYRLRGGQDYYMSYLEIYYDRARLAMVRRLSSFFDGVDGNRFHEIRKLAFSLKHLVGVFCDEIKIQKLENIIGSLESQESCEPYGELKELALDLLKFNLSLKVEPERFKRISFLDLLIWKDSLCSIEVKAPGDRIRKGQLAQLNLNKKRGDASWVVHVLEHGIR